MNDSPQAKPETHSSPSDSPVDLATLRTMATEYGSASAAGLRSRVLELADDKSIIARS